MVKVERHAVSNWEGNLINGRGRLQLTSGASGGFTWASRIDRHDGKTSPEELIAAAHAACYSMALSNTLSIEGKTPEQLIVHAVCTLEYSKEGCNVSTLTLYVYGKVPDIDPETFWRIAHKAERTCPISNALRGGPKIQLYAQLTTFSGGG